MYFSKDCQLHFGIFWTLNWGPVLPGGVGNPLSVATKKFKRFSGSLEKENKFGQDPPHFKWTLPLAKVMERLNMWRAPWKRWHKEGFRRTAGQLSGSSIKSTFRCPVVSKHTVGYLSSVAQNYLLLLHCLVLEHVLCWRTRRTTRPKYEWWHFWTGGQTFAASQICAPMSSNIRNIQNTQLSRFFLLKYMWNVQNTAFSKYRFLFRSLVLYFAFLASKSDFELVTSVVEQSFLRERCKDAKWKKGDISTDK